MRDRIDVITDILLGAAYADSHLHDRERRTIRELLGKLLDGDELPDDVDARIESFDPDAFDVAARAAEFAGEDDDNKRKLLELVAAVHDADEEIDLDEDDYVRAVAEAIELDDSALSGLVLEYEVEQLQDGLRALRASPPPIPGTEEVDVDLDD